MVAFLGRYGHQPADVTLDLTFEDMSRLANGVTAIMREEAEAMKRSMSHG